MFVKICGITSEEDALFAAAMGADAVGFVFAPSKRQMSAEEVRDISKRLPPELLRVGVFRNHTPSTVIETVKRSGVHVAQLHGDESVADVQEVRQAVSVVWKAFSAGHPMLEFANDYGVDAVMVDGADPGSGIAFDWALLDNVAPGLPLIVAGGLTPENVGRAIQRTKPFGVDVSTGVERSPGRKDPVKVRAFINNARAAAPKPYQGSDLPLYDWASDK